MNWWKGLDKGDKNVLIGVVGILLAVPPPHIGLLLIGYAWYRHLKMAGVIGNNKEDE